MKPSGHTAVMASRTEAPDSLDLFPTPPWSTRAVLPILLDLDPEFGEATVWEPACGLGHMAAVLEEAVGLVIHSDLFDYGYPACFIGPTYDFLSARHERPAWVADWVVTNPPFKAAADFAEIGLELASRGVALLVRTAWLEGGDRHARLFSRQPPRLVAQYAERVPMTKGRWDPDASTATAYCWVVWTIGHAGPTEFRWIPPGQRKALTRPSDIARFAVRTEAPLLAEAVA